MKHDALPHAWGLSLVGGRSTLARVSVSGADVVVGDVRSAAVAGGLHDEAAVRRAVDELRVPAGERVFVTLDDHEVLFHRLTLPSTDGAAMAAMVKGQAEVVLPSGMAWGWAGASSATDGETRDVMLAAASADLVNRAAGAVKATAVLPAAAAIAVAHGDDGERLLVAIGGGVTSVALVRGDRLVDCRTVEASTDDLRAWQRAVASLARPLLAGERGAGVILVASDDAQRVALEQALGVTASAWRPGWRIRDTTLDAGVVAAVGAALHGLRPPSAPLLLRGTLSESVAAPAWRFRRLAVAAAVAVAALLALFVMDLREADRREARVAELRSATSGAGGTGRALAIGKYLQNQPTPPLFVIESIGSAVSPQAQVKQLSYESTGRLRLSGTVQGVTELDKTLQGLSASPALDKVEMRTATQKDNTYTFEVEATVVPLHRYLALKGTEKKAAPKPVEQKEPATPAEPKKAENAGAEPSATGPRSSAVDQPSPRPSPRGRGAGEAAPMLVATAAPSQIAEVRAWR